MKKLAFLFLLLLVCPVRNAPGQLSGGLKVSVQGAEKPQPRQPLTNESILGLVKIGFSDETIIAMIEHEPGSYSLAAADVIALREGGVSEKAIRAMLDKSTGGQAPVGAPALTGTGTTASRDTSGRPLVAAPALGVPSEPGLYAQLSDGNLRHIAGRPTNFLRTGSVLASGVTAGIHARRLNTQIAGERAYTTVGQTPTFYYRVAQGAPDQVVPGTLNLILTKMTVKPGRRQFELEASGLMRRSQGISVRHQDNFDAQEIEAGLYRLQPDPLQPGQYAFFLYVNTPVNPPGEVRPSKAAALTGFVYDFQVE